MRKDSKIYVTHHHDMIGGSIVKALARAGYTNIILRTESELDLRDAKQTEDFFEAERPEYVFCFAGPHGGIIANVTYPADLMYTNLQIQNNVLYNAYKYGVKKLLFMVGSCAYPKESPQPILEEYLMMSPMEPTSLPYSTARVAGIVMCGAFNKQYRTNFIPAVLTNYYGENDDFSESGHVLASVLRKMCEARDRGDSTLTLWGTGEPKRQFMFIDDMADGAVLIMEKYENTELINIAGGQELSIKNMAQEIKSLIGFGGELLFDRNKPNGTMRKLLDNSKLKALGFVENWTFEQGLEKIYAYFTDSVK